MKAFEANFETVVKRFFLMMGVVILAGFTGQWWVAIFALPILLSAMLCVKFTDEKQQPSIGKKIQLTPKRKEMREAV